MRLADCIKDHHINFMEATFLRALKGGPSSLFPSTRNLSLGVPLSGPKE